MGVGMFLERKSIASIVFPKGSMDKKVQNNWSKCQRNQWRLDSGAKSKQSAQPTKYA